MKKLASALDPLWYKDAVIYELHVRAFADSNGDGIGDFPGLLSRLDYLQDLGVTCIWLLPFFPSPLRDDGYDIANYVDVNPSYGTLADFRHVLEAAHTRNMQVMIELVINHTSDQHPWFQAARVAPPGSPEHEMYVWSSSDALYKDARIIFTDTEKSNWTWDDTAKAFYWHRFFAHQPDLNFDNPRVLEEVLSAMRFWLDMGVDALRMDAIPYLVERDGTSCENLPQTHSVIRKIRAAIDADYANRLVLAEANQWPADVRPYFGDGDECHMAFHFPLMPRIYMALRQEDRLPITDIMAQTPDIPSNCQWGLFLRNHDELTLEMVTNDERDYMYFAYSADPRMRINVGIRRRLAPLVDNNRRRIELLNSLLLSFPGTPILYYGDEIGMGDNIYLGDRNGVRTPMQWNSDRNAGFSRCDPARLYFPVVMDPVYGYQVINVEAQLSDQSSLLHWTRNMIALRKLFQVFGRGTLKFLNPENRKILAYLRELDRGDGSRETVLCVANLSRFAQPVSLDLSEYVGHEAVEMLGYVSFPIISNAAYALSLAPYSFLWLELQPASELPPILVKPQEAVAEADLARETAALELLTGGWAAFMTGRGPELLQGTMRDWLPRQRWFGAKTRKIQTVRVIDWVEIPGDPGANRVTTREIGDRPDSAIGPALFFVEVGYSAGPPDIYQVPLAINSALEADHQRTEYPLSVLDTISTRLGEQLLLCDATTSEEFRQSVLKLIAKNETLGLSSFSGTAATEPNFEKDEREKVVDGRNSTNILPPPPVSLTTQPGEAVTPAHMAPADSEVCGSLEARASEAFNPEVAKGVNAAPGSAEQSNTSILYGDRLILKLFRRIQPGENPDVEIGRFLTEVARFPRIAPFLGEISLSHSNGEKTTVAMLQGLVENQGDGWKWFLEQLDGFFASVARRPKPQAVPGPSFLNVRATHSEALELASPAMQGAALLGKRTAEMHLALATPTSDPAFGSEPFTADDLAREAQRIDAQITSTLEALKIKLSTLKDSTADDAGLLLSRRIDLFARANAITALPAGGQRIRIHGDYHLGQTLLVAGNHVPTISGQRSKTLDGLTTGDFVLLDFEGEPARPLTERRNKQSPLKDVAGMIRSLSYVAFSGLDRFMNSGSELASSNVLENLTAWATFWQNSASSEFLRSYRETISANPRLLPAPEQAQALLAAYMLEKALYELLYELNNRPTWLRIPLAGILAL